MKILIFRYSVAGSSDRQLKSNGTFDVPKDSLIDVKGKVVDDQGVPLVGANVKIKGTNTGTTTENEGRFTIPNVDANAELEISYVGHETKTVFVRGKSFFTVNMVQSSIYWMKLWLLRMGQKHKD